MNAERKNCVGAGEGRCSHRFSLVRFFTARPYFKFFARLQSPRAEHRLNVKIV